MKNMQQQRGQNAACDFMTRFILVKSVLLGRSLMF